MRKFILIIITCLIISTVFSQERIWTKQTKVSEAITFEKQIDPETKFISQNRTLTKDFYPLFDIYEVENPVIVQRASVKYLPISAEYFYTPADSVLRLISYDWERDKYGNFFAKQKSWAEENTKPDFYNDEYNRIKENLLNQLGAPISADTVPQEANSDGTKYLKRETVWETDTIHAELSMIFANSTHRIRFTLYWKK